MVSRNVFPAAEDSGSRQARRPRHWGHPGTSGPDRLPGDAPDCSGLPGNRAVCAVSALDGSQIHALLCFLPRLLRAVRVQVHGCSGRAGSCHPDWKRVGLRAPTRAFPALCHQLQRRSAVEETPTIHLSSALSSGAGAGSAAVSLTGHLVGHRAAAAPAGPDRLRLSRRLLRDRSRGVLDPVPARAATSATTAVEVALARHRADRGPFYGAVCHSVSGRCERARGAWKSCSPVADPASADIQLGDCSLPPDGRGPDLQAGGGLHARHGRAGRAVLWGDRAPCGIRAQPPACPWGPGGLWLP